MKVTAAKRFILVPVIYLAVIFGLIFLQFSKSGGFTEKAGALVVTGSPAAAQDDRKVPITAIRVVFGGIEFPFSRDDELMVDSGAKNQSQYILQGFSVNPDGVSLIFTGGVRLRFSAPSGGDSLAVRADSTDATVSRIALPFSLSRGWGISKDDKSGMLTLKSSGTKFELRAAEGASIDPTKRVVRLARSNDAFGSVSMQRTTETAALNLSQFIDQNAADPAVFAKGLAAYLDASYTGWKSARFSSDAGWSFPGGKTSFNEKTLAALLAEARRRGEYGEVRASLGDLISNNRERLTYFSNPLIGNIVRSTQVMFTQDRDDIQKLQAQIKNKDASLFERENLVHFVLDRAPYALAQDTLSFAGGLDAQQPVRTAVGLLGCLIEGKQLLADADDPFLKLDGVVEKVIVPAIKKTQSGFFLQTDGTDSDLSVSIRAGMLLIAFGQQTGKPIFTGIGQSLVNSAVSIASDNGFLPARITIQGNLVSDRTGSLAPELVYPLISGNPYYPHEVSFAHDAAPGVWAWTSSLDFKLESGANPMVFASRFPNGETYFVELHGIKPFKNIQLYEKDFRSDPDFERYDSSGWVYKEETQTLYLKLRHKADIERVRLFF
jgi:hypothetical protein